MLNQRKHDALEHRARVGVAALACLLAGLAAYQAYRAETIGRAALEACGEATKTSRAAAGASVRAGRALAAFETAMDEWTDKMRERKREAERLQRDGPQKMNGGDL